MNISSVSQLQPGELVFLNFFVEKNFAEKHMQEPRRIPGLRPPCYIEGALGKHIVIFLEFDTSVQKTFNLIEDFDVKVFSPALGAFWISSHLLLTLDEYQEFVNDEKRKAKNKNKKKRAKL